MSEHEQLVEATGLQQQFKDLDIDANSSKEMEVAVETKAAVE